MFGAIPASYHNALVVSDALDYVRSLPTASVPLYLFSPPYNLGNAGSDGLDLPGAQKRGHYCSAGGMQGRGGAGKWSGGALVDGYDTYSDNLPWPRYIAWQHALLQECWRTLTPDGAIYYNHKPRVLDGALLTPLAYNPDLPVRQIIIWARAGGTNFSPSFYMPTHEWLVLLAKPDFRLRSRAASGVGDVWRIPQEHQTWHPAPFPLALADRVIETTMPAFVCDPFVGRGTTAVAAKRQGIGFIGCDRNATYIEQARAWLARTRPLTLRQAALQDEIGVQGDLLSEVV